MNPNPIINTGALEPLYNSWEEPNAHRVPAEKAGEPASYAAFIIAHGIRLPIEEPAP